jgi:hypothetical protein
VHPPERLTIDEAGQGVETEAVLAQREAALLAEVTLAQDVQRLGVVGAVDDPEVLAASDGQAPLLHVNVYRVSVERKMRRRCQSRRRREGTFQ